ncbi:MAG: hypothetical protein KF901_09540 [Myxococcales bacterium]|nr:hypothetical protein [Myxococcales bacterium]
MLIRHPHLARRAVTLSVPHPLTFLAYVATHPAQLARSAYMAFFQLPRVPERALAARRFALSRRLWRRWSPGFEPSASYWASLEGTLSRSMEGPLGYYRAMLRPLGPGAARIRHARGVTIPHDVLYLHGARDGCISPDARHGQARYFGAAFEERVLDAGHFLQLERPREVAALVDDWLGR